MRKEKIKYKVFAVRLNDKTVAELKRQRILSGLSWNLFIVELLKKWQNS